MSSSLLLVSLIAALASAPVDDIYNRALTGELLGLEQLLASTLHTHDREAMERLLDDEFVMRSEPDVNRTTWIQNAVGHCWGDRFEISHFDAHLQESVAIATFELTLHVNPATCKPATIRSLITDVWVQRDDGWRLRVRHSGPPIAATGNLAGQYAVLPQAPPEWKLDSELSFVGTAGNTSTQTLGLASNLLHQKKGKTTTLRVAFVTSEADQETRARSIDAQGRHAVTIGNGLDAFGRVAYFRDRFAGIGNRAVIESGLSYTAADTPLTTITLEGAAGFTAETHVPSMDPTIVPAPDQNFAVASGTLGYWQKITAMSELRNDVSVTADLVSGTNWRMTNNLKFQVTLTRLLSVKLSNAVEYRHAPVPGFRRTDTRTSASLVFSFQKRPRQAQ